MKKLFATVIFAAAFVAVQAQKTVKDENAEKRNVSGYKSISVSSGIDLFLSQGGESVAVSAAETKYRDLIKTEVENGVLKIYYDYKAGESLRGEKKMRAYVSFNTLEALTASGGSDVKVEGAIKSGHLKITVSGGSDFDGKVESGELSIKASGGSDVTISGTARQLDIHASGGSDLSGFGLSSDICKLQASGGSDIQITVNKELDANASGSSDIHYKGSAVLKLSSSGSSSVKKVS